MRYEQFSRRDRGERLQQIFPHVRLHNISGAAASQRRADEIGPGVNSKKDDRQLTSLLAKRLRHIQSAHAPHGDVQDNHVRGKRCIALEYFLSIGKGRNDFKAAFQHGAELIQDGRVIVGEQQTSSRFNPARLCGSAGQYFVRAHQL